MADKKISWCNWSLCDKNETSAALNQGANASDGLSNSELSDSGKIVFNSFKQGQGKHISFFNYKYNIL